MNILLTFLSLMAGSQSRHHSFRDPEPKKNMIKQFSSQSFWITKKLFSCGISCVTFGYQFGWFFSSECAVVLEWCDCQQLTVVRLCAVYSAIPPSRPSQNRFWQFVDARAAGAWHGPSRLPHQVSLPVRYGVWTKQLLRY